MIRFEGLCDVCGEPISLSYDPTQGMIDFAIDGNRMRTRVRHYATAPEGANPNCAIYSSPVIEVKEEDEKLEEPEPTEGDWYQTSWWRVIDPDGKLWGESSDSEEMLEAMRPGDTLQSLWAREDKEWRDAQ